MHKFELKLGLLNSIHISLESRIEENMFVIFTLK